MDYRSMAEEFMESRYRKKNLLSPPEDLSRGEVGILLYLIKDRDNVLAGELSRGLGLTSGRIAIALKSLEKKCFIIRKPHMEDGRKVVVCVTDEGRDFAEQGRLRCLDGTEKFLEFLGEEDALALLRIVKKTNGDYDECNNL